MDATNPNDLRNWLPSRLFEKDGELFLEWVYLWDVRFNKPFFSETISECKMVNSMKGAMQKNKLITPAGWLSVAASTIPTVSPDMFIFHTSRCGSTLVSQILSMDNQNIVFPEYPVFDAVLRAKVNGVELPLSKRIEWLKGLLNIMGQKRFPEESRLIIKLDCWHLSFYETLHELSPNTPVVILYRNPEATLASNNHKWGIQFIPEIIPPTTYSINEDTSTPFSINDYANKVLAFLYSKIMEIKRANPSILSLDYSDGIINNLKKILSTLNVDDTFLEQEEIVERLKFHSKNPNIVFKEEIVSPPRFASVISTDSYLNLNAIANYL